MEELQFPPLPTVAEAERTVRVRLAALAAAASDRRASGVNGGGDEREQTSPPPGLTRPLGGACSRIAGQLG